MRPALSWLWCLCTSRRGTVRVNTCHQISLHLFAPLPWCVQVVLEEGNDRKVIFSTFDPDVATLIRLKQPRYPVRPTAPAPLHLPVTSVHV